MQIENYKFFGSLSSLPYVEKILLYGSRARGDNQERADIDLAIVCPNATRKNWLELMEIIEEVICQNFSGQLAAQN
jgi:predicted nucleotidyltransferase